MNMLTPRSRRARKRSPRRNSDLAAVVADLKTATGDKKKNLELKRLALDNKLYAAQKELEGAQFLQPLVKRYLPNSAVRHAGDLCRRAGRGDAH